MAYNRIFLSYRTPDRQTVEQYYRVMTAMGLRPWMDVFDLPPGSSPVRSLAQAMVDCCAAVFFVTPHFEDTGYPRSEIDDALQQEALRKDAFRIITLVLTDENGKSGTVPEPLRNYIYATPTTHLDGLRIIVEALPPHLFKAPGYLPLQSVVPPAAKEVALVGQNLSSRLGSNDRRYSTALGEIRALLSRASLETLVLVMMTAKALSAIHPEAATHLREHSLPRLHNLRRDLPDETRITVAFHPSATLSMVAVDWTLPDRAFALVTPKLQRTAAIYNRVSLLLDGADFDAASVARMLEDAEGGRNGACKASLAEAPAILEGLLGEAGL